MKIQIVDIGPRLQNLALARLTHIKGGLLCKPVEAFTRLFIVAHVATMSWFQVNADEAIENSKIHLNGAYSAGYAPKVPSINKFDFTYK